MSWNCPDPQTFAGQVVGTGQCVAFVEVACSQITPVVIAMPHTPNWKAGRKVQGDTSVLPGTAIATFDPNGKYGNHTDGRSHAAILVEETPEGLLVWDQWVGQPVHERLIRFKAPGDGWNANNGIAFSVIELA
jgi:hypothetical protein